FSSRRRHTRSYGDWSSDVCSSDLAPGPPFDHECTRKCRGMAQREKSVVGDHHWITAQPGMLADAGCIPTKPHSRSTTSRCYAAKIGRASCRERVEGAGGEVAVEEE